MKVYNVKVEAKMKFHFPVVARDSVEAERIVHELCGVNGGETDDTELAGQLEAVKAELQPMKDIRYWVGKVLTLEQSEIEKKPEPKHSPSEQIKFYQEQSKQQQEQKTPRTRKQNMEL